MSLLFLDGFETEKNIDQKWEVHGQNPQYSISVDVVHSGTNALKLIWLRDNYNCVITRKISPVPTIIVGYAIRFEKISANINSFFYMENKIGESPIPDYGRRSYIRLKFNASSKIEAYFMDTLIGTGSKTINTNTQYYMENKLEFITPTAFQYTLKINNSITDFGYNATDVTADGQNSGYEAHKIFDVDPISTFQEYTAAAPHWIKTNVGSAVVATSYSFNVYNHVDYTSRMPRTQTFQGSNDYSNWTTLDTRTNITFSPGTTTYSFTNSTAYKYYQLNITAQNTAGIIRIAQMSIMANNVNDTFTDIYASRSDFLTATDHIDYITFIASSGTETGGPYGMYLDDIYILNGYGLSMNNFLGRCLILGSRINEPGTFDDFTSYDSTVSKVNALREITGDKNTYIYDHSMLSTQSFNIENISNVGQVYGATINQNIQKDTPRSDPTVFSPFVKNIDGVEHYRDDVTLTNSDQFCHCFLYEVDPFTGVPQTTSSINSTEIGLKIVAEKNINRAQVTQSPVETLSKIYTLNTKGNLSQAALESITDAETIRKYSYITQGAVDVISRTDFTAKFIDASGGTITYSGDYKIHTFIGSGTFNVVTTGNDLTYGTEVECLVVAGGGGGSSSPWGGGGGGAGGVIYKTSHVISSNQNIQIIVGGGGTHHSPGQDSFFGSIKAFAGGASTEDQPTSARQGGSGGGGGHSNPGAVGGPSIQTSNNGGTGYGNAGGTHVYVSPYNCGSGGGASAAGGTQIAGGAGKAFSISGSSITYAGGGGVVNNNGTTTAGGSGGGGAGVNNANGTNGTVNTGGGGGGSRGANGGTGGSGIVIVRYKYKKVQ